MNGLLARAGALFLAPAAAAPPRQAVSARPPDLVGVLATSGELAAVAGGVAAALRARHGARSALVLLPEPLLAARAGSRAARALARRLAGRDLRATAAGALCLVGLPDDGGEREAWRAISAAPDVPAVVALPARAQALDALLAQADELLLAAPPGDLAGLALASLRALGPPVALVAPPSGPVARRAAALGLRRLAPAPAGATA